MQALEQNSLVTVDLADSLTRISKSSNSALRSRRVQISSDWVDRVPLMNGYAPALSVVGRDLLVTFPDFHSILDVLCCDLFGHFCTTQTRGGEAVFHQGFIRDLPTV